MRVESNTYRAAYIIRALLDISVVTASIPDMCALLPAPADRAGSTALFTSAPVLRVIGHTPVLRVIGHNKYVIINSPF